MDATKIPLRAGMWLRDLEDEEIVTLLGKVDEANPDRWKVCGSEMGEGWIQDVDGFQVMDHPANVGPLFEACVDRWRDFFVDRTRSNVAPWRAFPRRGDAPIACEATLCGALLAALALPESPSAL